MCCAGGSNPEHYIVATQEKGLRQTLGGIPGGATVFASVNGLHIEPPSDAQRKAVEQAITARLVLTIKCSANLYICRKSPPLSLRAATQYPAAVTGCRLER